MNVAIVGSSGYIAGFLIRRFADREDVQNILTIDQAGGADVYLDLKKAEDFDYGVLKGTDYVIFTAAVSGPDQCAADFNGCWAVNVTGTSCFIRRAVEMGCRVVFFSSDAVFGDVPGAVYTEESETRAATAYGRMKKAVEDTFSSEPGFKAIRLSYVMSARDRFVSYCLNCMKNGQTAEVFHPFYRSCIAVSDVVQVVEWLTTHWEEYAPGVLNVAGRELVSRVRIADEINRCMGNGLNYTIQRPDEAFYRNRPAITQMESLYLRKYEILPDETFTEKIKRELKGINL